MSLETIVNPFASNENPGSMSNYGTPASKGLSVLFDNLKSIFSYKTFSEADLLDSDLKKWLQQDSNRIYFEEIDLNSGAGLNPLGFAENSKDVSGIITPGYSLPFFIDAFNNSASLESKFLFHVGALNFDYENSAITNDYVTPLNAASKLNFPVISPISFGEFNAVTLLALAVLKFQKKVHGIVNLFDAAAFEKTVIKNGETSLSKDILTKLESAVPSDADFNTILTEFNKVTGLTLDKFEYFGVENPDTVFVTFGTLESQLFKEQLHQNNSKAGFIAVRVPLPFDVENFVSKIPSSTKKIVVVGQCTNVSTPTFLRTQVSSALFYSNHRNVTVEEFLFEPNFIWSPLAAEHIMKSFASDFDFKSNNDTVQNFIFWASDKSQNLDISSKIVYSLSLLDNKQVSLRTKFDNVSNAGIFQSQISSFPANSEHTPSNIDTAEFVIVEDLTVLNAIDVTATIKPLGTLLVVSKISLKDKDLSSIDVVTKELKVPASFFTKVFEKQLNLIFVDADSINNKTGASGDDVSFVVQASFWEHAFKFDLKKSLRSIWETAGYNKELPASFIEETINTAMANSVKSVSYLAYKDVKPSDEEETGPLQKFAVENSFAPNKYGEEEEINTEIGNVSDATKHLIFKEAYHAEKALRPDLPVKNFVVKVKENRRVTPHDYDRNIFHIEFDISGTGLTYGIGEALGIHARNDPKLVKEFINYYGLNELDIVSVLNKDDNNLFESKTVLQALTDNLDLFGKPPKRFYESLLEYVTDEDQKKKLEDLISPAGAVDLKNFQEVEFYTYADIFELFPSARPPLKDLITLIAPLKRREYSIASSQKVHPNEVHLLIVVVDWVDKKGRKRFGQASKYISELSVGSELVVSVKPSVMKLPPSSKQPVIMSGLGTGLAPFKAIVEEKLWQKEQGMEIGEVFLFLGSRHKREEYLYGELWEAYKDAGIITHIGAAFSRDQPQKIYIQDRIKQVLDQLKTAFVDNEGSFYLCGPTWPVPDITQALKDIIEADAKEKGVKIDLDAAIEDLKDTARYILEVY